MNKLLRARRTGIYRCMCGGTRFHVNGEVLRVCDELNCLVYFSPFDNHDSETLPVLFRSHKGIVKGEVSGLPEVGITLGLHSEYSEIRDEFSGNYQVTEVREVADPNDPEKKIYCLSVNKSGRLEVGATVSLLRPM